MRLASAVGATVLRGVAWGRERREGLKLRLLGRPLKGSLRRSEAWGKVSLRRRLMAGRVDLALRLPRRQHFLASVDEYVCACVYVYE